VRLSFAPQRILRFVLINAVFIAFLALWNGQLYRESVQLAVAKSQQLLDMPAELAGYPSGYALDTAAVRDLALADNTFAATLAGRETEFLSAVRLSAGEARYWQDQGCDRLNCAYLTFYNYSDGGTIEAVINLDRAQVVGQWMDTAARPGGSSEVLPKAVRIAAADPQVRAVLGDDLGAMEPAMIPMSGWLTDNACREEWCVDLTFHDPTGTGRVYHVFVNLEQEVVARTFYTRARADRSAARPLAQRDAFTDGCHQAHGWSVCWEMTANDGINFRDATYNGQTIFSSAKIGQIEAWYPSWPGGYRDEIGFAATVPPFGDTLINDLGDGFEVRQIFTEFTRWPNCICCYRYEEVLQFYADGRFQPRFLSHGPGCDDLSIYRPFWRIDVDLDGGPGDQVWLFDALRWTEQRVEFETFPVVEDLSPEGHKLAIFDGDLHYRWFMERTDPLGLDEAYFFLLQDKPLEGEEPITTGPGDTFIPPRQWLDGDALSGEDIVLWWVPLLYTKKGGPWWCMPDPDPDFSPCEAILHAEPAGELRQPTAEELAVLEAQPTPTSEAPAATAAPTATPRPIEGSDAPTIILNAGCGACHKIGSIGEAHKVGPDLSAIGLTAGGRVPGMTAAEYIHESILTPNAYLAPACPNGPCLPNIMPRDYATRLSAAQQDTLVEFLLSQQGSEPTPASVGSGATAAATPLPKPAAAAKVVPPSSRLSSLTIAQIALALVVLVVSGYAIFRDRSKIQE
jgi:hypothetical protein